MKTTLSDLYKVIALAEDENKNVIFHLIHMNNAKIPMNCTCL